MVLAVRNSRAPIEYLSGGGGGGLVRDGSVRAFQEVEVRYSGHQRGIPRERSLGSAGRAPGEREYIGECMRIHPIVAVPTVPVAPLRPSPDWYRGSQRGPETVEQGMRCFVPTARARGSGCYAGCRGFQAQSARASRPGEDLRGAAARKSPLCPTTYSALALGFCFRLFLERRPSPSVFPRWSF